MNTYQISYDERHDGSMQSVDVMIRAIGYSIDGDTLTLLDKSPDGEFIRVASFRNWHSITDMEAVQE